MKIFVVILISLFSFVAFANDTFDDLWEAVITEENQDVIFDLQAKYTGQVISAQGYVKNIESYYSGDTVDLTLSLYPLDVQSRHFDIRLFIDYEFINRAKMLRVGDKIYFNGVFSGLSPDFREIYVNDVKISEVTENII
ncbi:MAG: hypothetical protein PHP69_05900 [Candidatus Omnitrophica bacterium]|nr:hypothetical protein [Candidatus Omnitrophota bacterium]MDD5081474.1 hypothetical protein [Candidatus Omnitrophota bacterium]MDD5441180.1 hypothetical protein [Candidatus Omnitrophota bacterium]